MKRRMDRFRRSSKPADRHPWAFAACALLLLLLACAAGCGSSKSGAQAAPAAPGRAALAVTVRAEPKKGWRDPRTHDTQYETSMIGAGRAYETVEYAQLDDIVVWVESSEASQAAQTITLDVARPGTPIVVSGTRDTWQLDNAGADPLPVYARFESGQVVDLGTIAPRGSVRHVPTSTGYVELLSDARAEPLARLYVAPIPTVSGDRARVVRGGTKAEFNDLAPGSARVAAWHPRLPGSSAAVNLTAGATNSATLVVGVNQLPKIP